VENSPDREKNITLVSAAENGDLTVHRHELDCAKESTPPLSNPVPLATHETRRTVAIPLLKSRIHRFCLVFAGIPENLEVLLRAVSFRIKCSVHFVYDFLIRATLEGNHLALVVESEVEI
jgi:hypothetical protein